MNPFGKQPVTGIEILEHEWRIVQVVPTTGAITVLHEFRVPFGPLPDDPAGRVAAKAGALRESLKQRRLRLTEARLCIPKSAVTVRYRRLPPSQNETELAQMARFEAERHIPFHAERHLIGYHVMGREELAGVDVLTVAVDGPVVEEVLTICAQAGIDVASADVSSLALYRLFLMRRAAPAGSPMKTGAGEAATATAGGASSATATALLHIGEESSEIVLLQNHIALFARSCSAGLRSLGEAMGLSVPVDPSGLDAMAMLPAAGRDSPDRPAELAGDAAALVYNPPEEEPAPGGLLDLNGSPEGRFERLAAAQEGAKQTPPDGPAFDGNQSLRPADSSATERTTEAQAAFQAWLERLTQEIRRTYEFAYREFNCPALSSLLISGAGARIGRMREYLERALGVSAGPLLGAVYPPPRLSPAAEAAGAGPPGDAALAIATALDNPERSERGVNLLPEAHLRRRRRQRQSYAVMTTAALALCALSLAGILFYRQNANIREAVEAYRQFIDANRARVAEIEKMEFEIQVFNEFRNPNKSALHILDYVCSLDVVERGAVKLTAFLFEQGKEVTLMGHAFTLADINQLNEDLARSPFFRKTEILDHPPTNLAQRTQPIYQFKITCLPKLDEGPAPGRSAKR